jgi:hypothetical protein
MKMNSNIKTRRDTSVEEYKMTGVFESFRNVLLREKYRDRMDKPLAYWALASDRRLPLAFMGRTLREILSTPFDELLATPGVGRKKIAALMTLLGRATKDTPPVDPFGLEAQIEESYAVQEGTVSERNGSRFDPSLVSEALWTQWRETVLRHGIGQLRLGRLVPSLQALPTVIWHTPLEEYAHLSLAEIRQLKTHGEKRVRAVLEAFWVVHTALAGSAHHDHLDVDLVPKFVRSLERWIIKALANAQLPTEEEVRNSLLVPLLAQIELDAGTAMWRLACGRLGIHAPVQSVRQQARERGVTRARVYQLLEDCSKVMAVRWPEGELPMTALAERFAREAAGSEAARLFRRAMDLFFPKHHEPVQVVDDSFKEEHVVAQFVAESGEPV